MRTSQTCFVKESQRGRIVTISNSIMRVALAAFAVLAVGQQSRAQEIQFGVDFNTVIPRGDFSKNITNNGYGIGTQFLVRAGGTPLLIGGDAGFVVYGSEKRRQPLSPSIPEVDLEVKTDNNIVLTHFLLRAQPRSGSVRPYADGLIGFKYLFTNTSISNNENDEELASDTNFSDLTFSYGFGGGVQVRLAGMGGNNEILLDTKVRYLRGSKAEYLKEGSIRRDSGGVFFDVLSSRTDVVTVQVGVTFRF